VKYAPPADPAELPVLSRALVPEEMLDAFARYLPPRDGTVWNGCAIERVSYLRGLSARVLYRLSKQGDAGETGSPHYFYAEFLPAARSLRHYLEAREGGKLGAPTGFVAELDMLYWRFPADPRLGHLEAVWREGPWRVVSYLPTINCVLAGSYGGEPTIVKLHWDDRIPKVSAVLQSLSQAGVEVPRVLHADPVRRLLVMEHVPGAAFWSQSGANVNRDVMAAMARQLAALHDTRAVLPEELELVPHARREWARFERARADLGAAFPDLRPRLERLVTMLGSPEETGAPTFVHGDFHPGQFLVHEGVPRLIDFDNVGRGDPMYDMAHFASQLYYKGHSFGRPLREIETAVSAFRSAYIGAGTHFVSNRWFWHLAVSLVAKRAHRVLTRLEAGAAACAAHLVTIAEQNAASIMRD